MRIANDKHGFALATAIILAGVIAMACVCMNLAARFYVDTARRYIRSNIARMYAVAALDAGAYRACSAAAGGAKAVAVSSLLCGQKTSDENSGKGWKLSANACGIVYQGIEPENAKININKVKEDVLGRLLETLGFDSRQGGSIARAVSRYPFFQKKDIFIIYLPEELRYLKEINADIYAQMAPYITTFGDGTVNVNLCSPVVLSALGMKENALQRFLSFRKGRDGGLGSQDDGVIDSEDVFLSAAGQNPWAGGQAPSIVFVTPVFRIKAEGFCDGVRTRIESVIQVSDTAPPKELWHYEI